MVSSSDASPQTWAGPISPPSPGRARPDGSALTRAMAGLLARGSPSVSSPSRLPSGVNRKRTRRLQLRAQPRLRARFHPALTAFPISPKYLGEPSAQSLYRGHQGEANGRFAATLSRSRRVAVVLPTSYSCYPCAAGGPGGAGHNRRVFWHIALRSSTTTETFSPRSRWRSRRRDSPSTSMWTGRTP